jgi:hypothetical protein
MRCLHLSEHVSMGWPLKIWIDGWRCVHKFCRDTCTWMRPSQRVRPQLQMCLLKRALELSFQASSSNGSEKPLTSSRWMKCLLNRLHAGGDIRKIMLFQYVGATKVCATKGPTAFLPSPRSNSLPTTIQWFHDEVASWFNRYPFPTISWGRKDCRMWHAMIVAFG